MRKVKTVGIYEIYEATEEECRRGHMGMRWSYPCFCVFYANEEYGERTPRQIGYSESDFDTLSEAEDWCEIYS